MRPLSALAAALVLAAASTGAAQEAAPSHVPRVYQTAHCGAGCPRIDGQLDDPCWNLVDWGADFTQWRPDEGKPPSQQTAFKILYDDRNLYVAYRAYDDEPEKIVSRLTRRDWFPGDWVEINIDSYHDRRTAYSFTSSVSGVRGDEFVSKDGDDWDGSWDPIWDLKTHVDAEGWTAEVRIPLSQLRYQPLPEQVWGIQVTRRVFREEERSTWQPKSQQESGWVSRFGELRGLVGLPVQRRVELLPYAVGRHERFAADPGDPFADGREGKLAAGLDGKIGVSSNLTLDFTVNPDFGQVEADPSELNLSEFETFFSERRPFFLEGNDILDYPVAPAITGGRNTSDILFYSRRIGRRPDWPWPTRDFPDYVELPEASSILGAAKLTGKTAGGWSLGVLESVTAREAARADYGAGEEEVAVEPATNWLVGRLQRDYRQGDTRIGGMVTAVNRKAEPGLDFMHRQAYAGGVDFYSTLWDRKWRVAANLLGSEVRGDSLALAATQLSSARYYQRPDNDEADFDPARRSLAGHAGSLRFGRLGSTGLRFETQVGWRSPGFEINDLGYMRESDVINQSTWVGWNAQPFHSLRSLSVNSNQWLDFDFGGNLLRRMVNLNSNAQLAGNASLGGGITRTAEWTSNTALRGGPALVLPGDWELNVWFNSDSRARFTYNFGGYASQGDHGLHDVRDVWFSVSLRPSNALRLTLNPDYTAREQTMQYVAQRSVGEDDRYLFATLDQKTLSMTLRADYAVTPNLSLQVYGAPFVTAGSYRDFKRITDPDAARFADRYHTFGAGEIAAADGGYDVDENADGTVDYSLGNPDFNFRDFNSNVVLRWEFNPGSLLYLVWSQSRSDFVGQGDFHPGHDLDALFGVRPHDVFLIKVSKWLSL
ncbi:MAG: carbohydrate binding family 9 domain-containing protein [Candidatus Latescibacteria bacterium]|nr:carbohydrate binding family 9 domain-containing protein [Candidatus Latescibacterota bacterium]MCB9516430.1 carbohydrate binding family 9 domain-containing protein [Candidatus Latescibacterota bacterium]